MNTPQTCEFEFDDDFYRPSKFKDMGIPQDVDDAIKYHEDKLGGRNQMRLKIAELIRENAELKIENATLQCKYDDTIECIRGYISALLTERKRSARWKSKCKQQHDVIDMFVNTLEKITEVFK